MSEKTVTLGGGAFPITPVQSTDDRVRKAVTVDEIDAWLRRLYVLAKIPTVKFRDGSTGLVNVPGKYVEIIDAMHCAMTALAHGDPLPDFAEPDPGSPKKARKK